MMNVIIFWVPIRKYQLWNYDESQQRFTRRVQILSLTSGALSLKVLSELRECNGRYWCSLSMTSHTSRCYPSRNLLHTPTIRVTSQTIQNDSRLAQAKVHRKGQLTWIKNVWQSWRKSKPMVPKTAGLHRWQRKAGSSLHIFALCLSVTIFPPQRQHGWNMILWHELRRVSFIFRGQMREGILCL